MAAQLNDHRVSTSPPPEISAQCSCGETSGTKNSTAELRQWIDHHVGTEGTDPYWAGS